MGPGQILSVNPIFLWQEYGWSLRYRNVDSPQQKMHIPCLTPIPVLHWKCWRMAKCLKEGSWDLERGEQAWCVSQLTGNIFRMPPSSSRSCFWFCWCFPSEMMHSSGPCACSVQTGDLMRLNTTLLRLTRCQNLESSFHQSVLLRSQTMRLVERLRDH